MRLILAVLTMPLASACAPSEASSDGELELALQDSAAFVEGWDRSGDGQLSYDEFVNSTAEVGTMVEFPESHLRDTFAGYDADGDGYITVDEMQGVARSAAAYAEAVEGRR